MFTGLVAAIGAVERIETDPAGARISIDAELAGELTEGDSIAVAGVCLTATGLRAGGFDADVMNQTLELTSLGGLDAGATVNLEPAMRASDRLGGHIVQGHVDAVGRVSEAIDDGFARRLRVELPGDLGRYVVERGSIALDGVSLTVAAVAGNTIEVSLIPETLARTTLGEAAAGTRINIEVDVIARHAERLLQGFGASDGK
jgi:riboflavin synthase